MARYQADVWLGSASGRQRIYVNSNTVTGAREQIKTIYHVNDNDIWNLNESRDRDGGSSGGSSEINFESILGLGAIILVIAFWKYILVIGIISLVIWLIYHFTRK